MNTSVNKIFVLFFMIQSFISYSQQPSWPLDDQWNQINCTFAEKHTAFHGAIDINLPNNNNFKAILNGIVEEDAINKRFMITRHDFYLSTDINSHLKLVRYGDDTDPVNGIIGINTDPVNYSTIVRQQIIGKSVSGGHLHFEMWIRDCTNGCEWYRVDPLNNPYPNYQNQPPGYNDIYDVELNDVILEPQDNMSGIIFNAGNGLENWHYNSCKIHKKDRPDSQGEIHSYYGRKITVFGNILPTVHVRDTKVTNGINSTGEGLGIFQCAYFIDDLLKYNIRFDEIQQEHIDKWQTFFNYKFNNATNQSILYGNHDYIKMYRLNTDTYCAPHKSIDRGIWKTRVKDGSYNEITDIPTEAKYKDGKHDVDFSVFDAAGNRDDASNLIYIDNFWPYIQEIRLYLIQEGENDILIRKLTRNSYEGSAALNDGFIINTLYNPEFYYTENFRNYRIEVTTSEPMKQLYVNGLGYENIAMEQNVNNPLIWEHTYYAYLLNDDCWTFEFSGKDKNDNDLLDVSGLSNQNGQLKVRIPVRIANNGNAKDWSYDPASKNKDRVTFCFFSCEDDISPRESYIINETEECMALENIEVDYADIPCNSQGYIRIDNINPLDYNIQWTNDLGDIIDDFTGKTMVDIYEPGVYCYDISYEGCCSISNCVEIKEFLFDETHIHYIFNEIEGENEIKNLEIEIENVPDIYDYNITLDLTDESGNTITLVIEENGSNIVDLGQVEVGKRYCIHIENDEGYCYDDCFTVEGNSCDDNYFSIDAVITNATCPFDNGSIEIVPNVISSDGCETWSVHWDDENGSNTPNITNLAAGTYCVTVYFAESPCNDCYTVECFEVLEQKSESEIDVDAVIMSRCTEVYIDDYNKYIIKWYAFIDMTIVNFNDNYTITWYPNPANVAQDGNSFRFSFEGDGPYCVIITDDCGNIYQNCFENIHDTEEVVLENGTSGIQIIPCLSTRDTEIDNFYRNFAFTNPEFYLDELLEGLVNNNYPMSYIYNSAIIFNQNEFNTADTIVYEVFVDNKFTMGQIEMPINVSPQSNNQNKINIKLNNSNTLAALQLLAYPNPFSKELYIKIESKEKMDGIIEIYNTMGQQVYSREVLINNSSNKKLTEISGLQPGIYNIVLRTKKGDANIKIIKVE